MWRNSNATAAPSCWRRCLKRASARGHALRSGGNSPAAPSSTAGWISTQAEAVAEIIAAPSKEGARLAAAKLDGVLGQRIGDFCGNAWSICGRRICLAVDFPEEEVECLPQEGFLSAIADVKAGGPGPPARRIRADPLLARRRDRSPRRPGQRGQVQPHERPPWPPACRCDGIPRGTTRDFLEEPIELAGLPVRLVDTAGLRETDNPAEAQGIQLGRSMIESADVVLLMVDGTEGTTPDTWALLSELGPDKRTASSSGTKAILPPLPRTGMERGRTFP